jgi:glycosyltransferase involved in cell wall biosynthesis
MHLSKNNFSSFNQNLTYHTGNIPNPKVSVCLNTYKQEKYIVTCLESILNQQVNFSYELLIGDDGSKDRNPELILATLKKYEHLSNIEVKAYLHPVNIGPVATPGKNNFLHTFFESKGEYVVHIEGDDFFTDNSKLQKQVDFLDKNQHYSACFHNALIQYDDDSQRETEYLNSADQPLETTAETLMANKEVWFMATASVMMRKKHVATLPDWFMKSVSGDIPLYIILSTAAPIGYLPDVMTVYRKNLNGLSYFYKQNDAVFVKNRIALYTGLNKYTQGKHHKSFRYILTQYYSMLVHCKQYQNNIFKRLWYTFKAAYYNDDFKGVSFKNFVKAHAMQGKHLTWPNLKKWFFTDFFASTNG